MLHWPALVTVDAGAVTVIVCVTAGFVVGTSHRFTTGLGVAAARRAKAKKAQKKVVEMRENILYRAGTVMLVELWDLFGLSLVSARCLYTIRERGAGSKEASGSRKALLN